MRLPCTASSFKFPNNLEFSAKTPQSAPLLSINVPLGLQYEANPGSIINQSQAIDSNGEIVGLQVLANRTLALIGGDVVIEGGSLIAPSGRIELGSVADNSFVSLASNDTGYVLNYEGIEKFKDIRLTQAAYVATDGDTGGSIQVQSANATLTDGARISAITSGKGTGIGITLNTTERVQLIGSSTARLYPTALLVNSDPNRLVRNINLGKEKW
ncbi:S-layer family protein [Nostoc flagelliforme FACHB-838]|uniref:S-layer family protein n=1 Tax=Nostoc flagelliforme FACHB-838 TaxID=2692904 RepID=A0ABR8E9J9_9NOSO|nr:S-layer family protein [Nostoc flagelliforme]MBD2537180.1 S-layer family protein [Nostoc flagelliforme FACHB-838]